MSTTGGGSSSNGARGRRRVSPEVPPDLAAAPGYGARRMYQAYLAAWSRHVDPVMTGPQFAVLSAVRAYPGFDQTALANAVALDTSTMADVCRRLEKRGLIVRGPAPHDARAKILTLTDAGIAAFRDVTSRTRRLDEALLAGCPAGRREEIAELLNDLGRRWEAVAEGPEL